MKPVASTLTEIDTMEGDEVKFSISPANSAWVMRSMADLYSNRELACIREYSTNAYDSNKEKALRDGTEIEPIHVTLPSVMNPYFTVQDFGVGMSETELRDVYTQFGESTKRDSDEFNGMLGFGSKSAIAYTNTLTVEAVQNKIKTVGVITRREDAMGGYLVTMRIVISNMATSESDGVKIQIPVHNYREFEQKAMDFYRFWLPGRVLVNGKPPVWAVGEKIDENLYYSANNNASYVVMGNVPYKIANPDALFPQGMNRISFVAYVPVGAVEFTPAREALKYSEHTKNNLKKIIDGFVTKSVQFAKDEIAAANTHAEAYKAWAKWRKIIGNGQVEDLTFKGDKLVESFDIEGSSYYVHAYRYGVTNNVKHWSVSQVEKTIFVTDFNIELKSTHRKKVTDWLATKSGIDATYYFFTPQTKIDCPWVDPDRVFTWQQIKDEAPKPPKKPRAQSVSWGRKAGSFDLVSRSGRQNEQDVPNVTPLYYIMVQEYNVDRGLGNVLDHLDMDDKVVLVPANRKDKFLRHYPKAKHIVPELRAKIVYDGPSLLSKDAKEYFELDTGERNSLAAMKPEDFDDPQIKRLIKLCTVPEREYLKDYEKNFRLASLLGERHNFKKHDYANSWRYKNTPASDIYPLIRNWVRLPSDETQKKVNRHIKFYINAVYAARKEGKIV